MYHSVGESNNFRKAQLSACKDALVYGLGAVQFKFLKNDKGVYACKLNKLNPKRVVLDLQDESDDFSASSFIGYQHKVPISEAVSLYPKLTSIIDHEPLGSHVTPDMSASSNILSSSAGELIGNYITINEIQYKKYEYAYSGYDDAGNYFCVWDKEYAHQIAASPQHIAKEYKGRVYKVLWARDIILENSPMSSLFAQHNDFSIILCTLKKISLAETGKALIIPSDMLDILKKNIEDFDQALNEAYAENANQAEDIMIPQSLTAHLIDLQRVFNICISKTVYYADAVKVITSPTSAAVLGSDLKVGVDDSTLEAKLTKPNGVLVVPDAKGTQIIRHDNAFHNFIQTVNAYLELFSHLSGVRQELMGGSDTNFQQSGIAIHLRQVASVKNNLPVFESFETFATSIARKFSYMITEFLHDKQDVFFTSSFDKKTYGINVQNKSITGSGINTPKDMRLVSSYLSYVTPTIEEVKEFQSTKEEKVKIFTDILYDQYRDLYLKKEKIREFMSLYVDQDIIDETNDFIDEMNGAQQQAIQRQQ